MAKNLKGCLVSVTCVQEFLWAVTKFLKKWGICTLRYARSKNAPLGDLVGPLWGLDVALGKKVRVIFGILHTKMTCQRAKLVQIGGKWAKSQFSEKGLHAPPLVSKFPRRGRFLPPPPRICVIKICPQSEQTLGVRVPFFN